MGVPMLSAGMTARGYSFPLAMEISALESMIYRKCKGCGWLWNGSLWIRRALGKRTFDQSHSPAADLPACSFFQLRVKTSQARSSKRTK